ncbi:PRTRC system protein E [Flavobacterium sp. RHBU_24]|uniref:PRTRC system protein E n=1 Tax=Flavobacterium sp. RHBU_24 TaxID=3391185 RepID=UPI0039846393
MAITNFFSQVAALNFTGCLNLTLRKDGESLTVSVLLQNDACGDTAKNHIPPLILKGTAQELGEGFFPAVAEPVQETSQLLTNMAQYLKGQEEAKKNSAMEKKKTEKVDKADKSDKPTTPEEIKEMKYKGIMAEVDKLEAAGKYREAWIKVPQASEFPDKTEEMQKCRSSLSAKFSPDLFGAEQPATAVTNVEPKTEQDATDSIDAEGVPDER